MLISPIFSPSPVVIERVPPTFTDNANIKDGVIAPTANGYFDLNIDFNRKNVKDFMTLSKANEYVLDNKNTFLKSEVKVENFQRLNEERSKGLIQPPSVFSETQKVLKNNHIYI